MRSSRAYADSERSSTGNSSGNRRWSGKATHRPLGIEAAGRSTQDLGQALAQLDGRPGVNAHGVDELGLAIPRVPAVDDDQVRVSGERLADESVVASILPPLLAEGLRPGRDRMQQPVHGDPVRRGQLHEPVDVERVEPVARPGDRVVRPIPPLDVLDERPLREQHGPPRLSRQFRRKKVSPRREARFPFRARWRPSRRPFRDRAEGITIGTACFRNSQGLRSAHASSNASLRSISSGKFRSIRSRSIRSSGGR
jgi:hypothetical protein